MERSLHDLVVAVAAARKRRRPTGDGRYGAVAGWEQQFDDLLRILGADHSLEGESVPGDRLDDLAAIFDLSPLDTGLIAVAAAPDLDPNIGQAFALLQGENGRSRSTVALTMELCEASLLSAQARSRLAVSSPLARYLLLQVDGDQPFPGRALRVPDRVVSYLLGDDSLDPLVSAMRVEAIPADLPETAGLARSLAVGLPLCWVESRPGGAGPALAAGALASLGLAHLAIDVRHRPTGLDMETVAGVAVREAGLQGAGLVVAGGEVIAEDGDLRAWQLLEQAPVPVIVIGDGPWNPAWLTRTPLIVEAATVAAPVRAALWRQMLGDVVPEQGGDNWLDLVGLRLAPEDIAQASRQARVLALAGDRPVELADAREAARRLGGSRLQGADRARSRSLLDDLVLPPGPLASLRELVDWSRHRDEVLAQGPVAGKGGKGRGLTALFAGSPGTGKTLAARAVAGELGLDLYTVELASVVDKYIGETEKNLERVFHQAENLNVVLFFDEADALFGSRSEVKDAHDRYANLEVSYLLQRMESFDGIAILATNLRGNLDTAFSRRLHVIVHFPDPDVPTRRRLWETHLDALAETDPNDAIDVDHLARVADITGGDIRNIVLAAAYSAAVAGEPVGMRHVVAAIGREYRKLGRRLPSNGFDAVPD